MGFIIINVKKESIYGLIYSIIHFLAYILLINFTTNNNTDNRKDRNKYLFIGNICEIFYLVLYLLEKNQAKGVLNSTEQDKLEDEIVGDKFLSEKDEFESKGIAIKEEDHEEIYLLDIFIIICIFIFCGIVNVINQKVEYFLLNDKIFYNNEVYSCFYYSLFSLIIFGVIILSKKIILNNYYSVANYQIVCLGIFLLLSIFEIINFLIGKKLNLNKDLSRTSLYLLPLVIILEGIKYIFIKFLMAKYYLSNYFILGIFGLINVFNSNGIYYLTKIFSNKNKVYENFQIGFPDNPNLLGIPIVIFLVVEKFLLLKTINSFSPSLGGVAKKSSDWFIFLFQVAYFLKEGEITFGVKIILGVVIETLGVLGNLIFGEIVIFKVLGLEKSTYYYLKKRAIKNYHTSMVLFKDDDNNLKEEDSGNALQQNIIS